MTSSESEVLVADMYARMESDSRDWADLVLILLDN